MGKREWWGGRLKEPRISVASTEWINKMNSKSVMLSNDMKNKIQVKKCADALNRQNRVFGTYVHFLLNQKM